MRARAAGAVWAAAVALGGLTGAYALPDVGAHAPPTAPSTASATPSPSPSPTRRLTEDDLLSVRSFADESVAVVDESDGKVTRDVDATSCVDDDVHKTGTLKKFTGYDVTLEGFWTQTDTGDGARQQVAAAADADEARKSVTRLVVAMESCQEATPGHVVLGLASTVTYSPTRSATWVGRFTEEQNTTGRAPKDAQPCGGTVLARNGARFTAVNVYMCLDGAQLAGLAESASERLG